MTDAEYTADCIAFLRSFAAELRMMVMPTEEDIDKLEEIATSLQLAMLEGES